jgi:hypothetical protein
MIDVGQARLRSNPRFRLIPYDQLQTADREAFRSLSEDADFFGMLFPPEGSALPVKSVSRDAALLFMSLREPACLPHLLDGLFGSGASERLEPLILDGVFEIERSGQFVSGAAASARLGDPERAAPASKLTRLSSEAIGYAAALELLPVQDVAMRLYRFNTAPATPALHRRFADDVRLFAFLSETNEVVQRLQSRWRSEPVAEAWLAWSSGASQTPLAYKLYISPTLVDLPAVFAAAVDAFAKVRCTRFKLGRGAFGVLRPDKLVAYFVSLDMLQRAAELILARTVDSMAQGVPFTAPIDPGGLLSWGMDPPRFDQVPAWQQVQSWRQWLTGRIATYAQAARQDGADIDSFVRSRVELDGVDPLTWTPDLAIWRGPVGTGQEAS